MWSSPHDLGPTGLGESGEGLMRAPPVRAASWAQRSQRGWLHTGSSGEGQHPWGSGCCGEGCPKQLALQGGVSPRGQEPLSRTLLHP